MIGIILFGANAFACEPNQIDVNGDGTNCVDTKFTITTTELAANTEFKFSMSASGTFYVDCGNDGTLSGTGVSGSTTTRNNTTDTTYTCTYTTSGVKTIRMAGLATGYGAAITYTPAISFSNNSNFSCNNIASIDGSLGAIFPTLGNTDAQIPSFYATFLGCSGLQSLPDTLFSGVTGSAHGMFANTFQHCSGLTSLPDTLFSGITGSAYRMFGTTFYGCTGLQSIPDTLFSGITGSADSLFIYTFYGCTGLQSIPDTLFSGITGSAESMFQYTFYNCTSLQSLPESLFAGVDDSAPHMFQSTFYGCNNLKGYIPPSMFSGLIANGSPYNTYSNGMMAQMFDNTGSLTTVCPVGTIKYTTGYESYWNSHVACETAKEPHSITYELNGGTNYADAPTMHYSDDGYDTVIDGIPTKTNYRFVAWCTDSALTNCAYTQSIPDTDTTDKTFYAKWESFETKFSITTKNLSANTTFKFNLSAIGTFNVDWGDGTMDTINRTNTTSTTYQHTYTTAGPRTIKMNGLATGYNTNTSSPVAAISFSTYNNLSGNQITSIDGSLGAMFPTLGNGNGQQPRFYQTCYGCNGLQSIPATLFSGVTGNASYMFYQTFYYCRGLQSIPDSLFSGVTGNAYAMFNGTFLYCTGLQSLPDTLFSGVTGSADYMFYQTFYYCTGLQSIPDTLFSGVTGSAKYMFYSTFRDCTGLQSIPATLFSGMTGSAESMFYSTFQSCTGLQSIPGTLFSGVTGSANYMFQSTFQGCTGLQSIPGTLFSGVTGSANYMFNSTFQDCIGLQSIPATLFSGVTGSADYMFQSTFQNCTRLQSIPATLFSGVTGSARSMFSNTFQDCIGLQSIPETLFSGVTGSANYMFLSTFRDCTGLQSIPATLFSGVTGSAESMFQSTFQSCTGLQSIPATLFSGVIGSASYMFNSTFYGCNGLTSLPDTLFSGVTGNAYSMFSSTFRYCTGLQSIPGTLFSGVTGSAIYMFQSTFQGCTGLQSLPENLFSGVSDSASASQMFYQTFYGCTGLTGYIPVSMFGGLIMNGSPYNTDSSGMMYQMFYNTGNLATSCPDEIPQYITGYESYWDSHVACYVKVPHSITYILNGGTNYENAPATYDEGIGVVINGVPNRAGKIFEGWCTDSALTDCALTQTISGSDTTDKVFYAKWIDPKFWLTTTNTSGVFYFDISASGTFKVDCGDGGTLSSYSNDVDGNIITKNNTSNNSYYCSYSNPGVQTIQMAGLATGYNTSTTNATISFSTNNSLSGNNIASIGGSLGAIFPTLGQNEGQQPRFYNTFNGCTNLQSIPGTLFSGVTGGTPYMFYQTFYDCNNLRSIPSTLFSSITSSANYMFQGTFYNCYNLQSLPENLFSGITDNNAYGMFYNTFGYCTGLTGYIPASMFSGLISNHVQYSNDMMSGMFYSTSSLAYSCPTGTKQYITGYEPYWDGHVACYVPILHTITYELNDGTSHDYLPEEYEEGFEVVIDGIPTKENNVFVGWCSNSALTNCALPWRITARDNTDKTLYAKWSECRACDTVNASCDMNIVDNKCVYTTTCDAGYDVIYNEGQYNAYCMNLVEYPIHYELDGGTNYTDAPESYWSGFGEIVDGIPSKENNFFGGWCKDAELTDCSMAQMVSKFEEGEQTFYAKWVSASNFKFMAKTTELEDDSDFYFAMSAKGTFTVDWGDGTAETIERDNTDLTVYSHNYATGGVKTIRMGGVATGYATPNANQDMTQFTAISFDSQPIAAIDGTLGSIFPTLGSAANQQPLFIQTFNGCDELEALPDALFRGVTGAGKGMFAYTFAGTGIKSIPSGLFKNVSGADTGMFAGTFMGCEDLVKIPETLFHAVHNSEEFMFAETFSGTNISSIPENLFSTITNGAEWMFSETFADCQNLTALPENLFASITTAATGMFESTFADCYDLTGYIPTTLFAGLIENNSPYESDMFYLAFANTDLYDECPNGSSEYITKYEEYWDYRVSCQPLPKHSITYVLNGGTVDVELPTLYYEGIGEYIDVIPTKKNNIFMGWCWDANLTNCNVEQIITELDTTDITLYAKWAEVKFTIVTTDLSNNPYFSFDMSARGSFVVDWGDGTVEPIQRFDTNLRTYDHYYDLNDSDDSVKVIRMGGLATEYAVLAMDDDWYKYTTISFQDRPIAAIRGSLGAIFPTLGNADNQKPIFMNTFMNTYLVSIPETLFNGVTVANTAMFAYTFYNTPIGSIPANLFSGVSGAAEGMFMSTFAETFITSIPAGLFNGISGAAEFMFSETFSNCYNLTSIPAGLFNGVTGAADYMFQNTFQSCNNLTSIPSGLFSGVNGAADYIFSYTFQGCNNLKSIPAGLFNGISGAADYMFQNTFYDCYNLASIPAGLFSGVTGAADYMFSYTFSNCSSLNSIPSGLFSGVTGAVEGIFQGTFQGCNNLKSIPAELFSGVNGAANYMFQNTFNGCYNLDTIPSGLFSGVNGAADYMFQGTFSGSQKLTSIPAGLFARVTNAAYGMFNNTFAWCNNLTGYIPPSTFAGLIANGSPYESEMFNYTFGDTNVYSECPIGTQQYITNYEDYWNGRVSCEPVESLSNITYVLNGGTNFENAPTSYQEGVGLTISGVPTKDGYLFAGWCWDEELTDCSMPLQIYDDVSGDIELYAKWTTSCECSGNDGNATCEVIGVSEDNKTCTYVHTCDAGYWNANNGIETASDTMYCDQCSEGSYCPSGATAEISCTTVGDGSYIYSDYGADNENACYRDCQKSDVPYSQNAYGTTYYGDNAQQCSANSCEMGYYSTDCDDNNCYDYYFCRPNEIEIIWSDATEQDIATTDASYTVYGGQIRAPHAAKRIPGKKFKGWRFVNPAEMPPELRPVIPEPQR